MAFGKYQFLSWSRRGIARNIIEEDTLGKSEGSGIERARIPVAVTINASTKHDRQFDLIGPADVTGIQSRMIVRTEPLNGIADFEPNLIPYIEFYDEDFPWRYTPAMPAGTDKSHLRPWLALIVLKENEFLDTDRRKPLPSIRVAGNDLLPPADQLHLWAHMHSNMPHEESVFETFLDNLEEDVKMDPDGIYSRLMCPRKLEAKALYHAFLIPAYETGRLAGLGMSTAGVKAQKHAFGGDLEFPVYFRWYFRTGKNVDFEYLVKLLEPRVMDERVGVRPMDCSRPAFIQADTDAEVAAPDPEIMLLEGALKAPNAPSTDFPPEGVPQPFFSQIEKLIDLNRLQQENENEDPFVTIPYYGMNHAMRRNNALPGKKEIPQFIPDSPVWYNDLNRDPRSRVPAGFGMRVVQQNQEKFMEIAWKQLTEILEANKRMILGQFTSAMMEKTFEKSVAVKAPEDLIVFAKPLVSRILNGQETIRSTIKNSVLPNAVFQPGFIKMTRNKTSLMRGLGVTNAISRYSTTVKAMNKPAGLSAFVAGNFSALAPLRNLKTFTPPASVNQINVWSMQSNLDENFAFNIATFQGGLPPVQVWNKTFNPILFKPVSAAGGGVITERGTVRRARPDEPTRPVRMSGLEVTSVTRPVLVTTTIADNLHVTRIKTIQIKIAYSDASFRFEYRDKKVTSPNLKTAQVTNTLKDAITPLNSYKKLLDARVKWPLGVKKPPKENFLPAMAYPDIPEPSYKYLLDIDEEFLLPNLRLIPPNTLSLLRTNQKFIEAYLMGLNHEMGRELLWREYPTDMRGSYFRQFWDVAGFVTPDTTPRDAEDLKDIEPIHTWPGNSRLGRHNKRDKEGDSEQLVFVIKGDLLRNFPNTVIYAQKALKDGSERKIRVEMTEAQFKKEVRFPLYQAEIKPEIKLLGFDLTIEEASGENLTPGFTDKQGWFFVIAEVPGEPHFGMDVSYNPNQPATFSWNDLSWENFDEHMKFVRSDVIPGNSTSGAVFTPPNDSKAGIWGKSSADMASILFQRPVMVAIHATEMLDVDIPTGEFAAPLTMTTLKIFVRSNVNV